MPSQPCLHLRCDVALQGAFCLLGLLRTRGRDAEWPRWAGEERTAWGGSASVRTPRKLSSPCLGSVTTAVCPCECPAPSSATGPPALGLARPPPASRPVSVLGAAGLGRGWLQAQPRSGSICGFLEGPGDAVPFGPVWTLPLFFLQAFHPTGFSPSLFSPLPSSLPFCCYSPALFFSPFPSFHPSFLHLPTQPPTNISSPRKELSLCPEPGREGRNPYPLP